jgi:hypothetical protein
MTDHEKVKELINTKLIFTQEDHDLCMSVDPQSAKEYLFYHSWNNTWLNLNIYSERDKEEHDLRMERGY